MTAPNMAAITASLERSFQNCSLNHHHHHAAADTERSSSSDETDAPDHHRRHQQQQQPQRQNPHLPPLHSSSSSNNNYDAAIELNSDVSLPYHWEQCLDLKTGEIYYINWRNGMRANEDPRITPQEYMNGDYYYSDDDDEDDDDDGSSSCDSEESSPCTSRDHYNNNSKVEKEGNNNVLVVAGCKRCLMYFMVPKQVEDCPKCCGHLLHFDRSDSNGSP